MREPLARRHVVTGIAVAVTAWVIGGCRLERGSSPIPSQAQGFDGVRLAEFGVRSAGALADVSPLLGQPGAGPVAAVNYVAEDDLLRGVFLGDGTPRAYVLQSGQPAAELPLAIVSRTALAFVQNGRTVEGEGTGRGQCRGNEDLIHHRRVLHQELDG